VASFAQKVVTFTQMTQMATIYAISFRTSRARMIFFFFSVKTICMGLEMVAKPVA
jgi:hypothetical protein